MAIKTILVSQPKPETEKSPYFDLATKYNVKVDFRPFIKVEGIDVQEFRSSRVHLNEYTAVILNSKNAVDHYFRLAKETRFTVPESMKYFCLTEAIAYYLQKYVVFRKRKIFHGKQKIQDLMEVIKKNKDEKFVIPCSDIHKNDIPDVLDEVGIKYSKAIMFKTVSDTLSDLADVKYDMLAFFSPQGIESLFENFPKFKQNETKIAAFGQSTIKAAEDAGLVVDIKAPLPECPSMTMAIERYLVMNGKKK
ncbi:MAG: uroporphyrinogen-III synthase [Flavobacteriales bacterium]